jgi:hypothetical protein
VSGSEEGRLAAFFFAKPFMTGSAVSLASKAVFNEDRCIIGFGDHNDICSDTGSLSTWAVFLLAGNLKNHGLR